MPTKPKTLKPMRGAGRQMKPDRLDTRPSRRGDSKLYGWRWQKARARFLKANPLCVHCLGADRVTPANEVDHIEPHRGDLSLFWDSENWQALCKPCHSRKTASEGAFGRR